MLWAGMIGEDQRRGPVGPFPDWSLTCFLLPCPGAMVGNLGVKDCQEGLTPWVPDISFLMLPLFISPCLPLLLPAQLGPALCQRPTRELALPPQRGLFHER